MGIKLDEKEEPNFDDAERAAINTAMLSTNLLGLVENYLTN
jgi:hypothetical protein